MSCKICGRSSCASWMHSSKDQERYEARQKMSDDVDTLRQQVQDLEAELAEARKRIAVVEKQACDALDERDGLQRDLAEARKALVELTEKGDDLACPQVSEKYTSRVVAWFNASTKYRAAIDAARKAQEGGAL